MCTLNVYEWPHYICIQGLLLTSNELHIMVTLGIYFEYIKVIFTIFTIYIATILQLYLSYFIILPKTITNDICYFIIIILFIFTDYLKTNNSSLIL
jgi:hypothetical protein